VFNFPIEAESGSPPATVSGETKEASKELAVS
jgi:hypothetical protein